MKTLYLISYDNGESWDDHRCDPVCIVTTEQAAKDEIARIMAWVERKRRKVPVQPDNPWPDDSKPEEVATYDKVMEDWSDSVQAYIGSLKPPHGETGFLSMVRGGIDSNGYLVHNPLPFLS